MTEVKLAADLLDVLEGGRGQLNLALRQLKVRLKLIGGYADGAAYAVAGQAPAIDLAVDHTGTDLQLLGDFGDGEHGQVLLSGLI